MVHMWWPAHCFLGVLLIRRMQARWMPNSQSKACKALGQHGGRHHFHHLCRSNCVCLAHHLYCPRSIASLTFTSSTSVAVPKTTSTIEIAQPRDSSSSGLTLNSKVGIGVSGLGFLVLCGAAIFMMKRMSKKKRVQTAVNADGDVPELPTESDQHQQHRFSYSFRTPKSMHNSEVVGIALTTDVPQAFSPRSSAAAPRLYMPYRKPCSADRPERSYVPYRPPHPYSADRPERLYRPYRPPTAPFYELE